MSPPLSSPFIKLTIPSQSFIAEILKKDPNASVIMAGDFNEYTPVAPTQLFEAVSGMVDMDVAAGVPASERYTYTFGQNMQELDHMYVSPAIARKTPELEHIHVNTWVSYADATSDHDPTVARVNVCKA